MRPVGSRSDWRARRVSSSIISPARCTTTTQVLSTSHSNRSSDLESGAMQYRELGKTGIKVSAVGFGAWAIGGPSEASGAPLGWGRTTDEDALAAMRRARDLGVTFFDTADSYGFGRSESLLGIVLSRKRQDVVIATKVGVTRSADASLRKDFSKQHIFAAIDGSLRRLRSDYV